MVDELTELLDIALDREIVSQAFYIAGQKRTQDQGAIKLMQELAAEELGHAGWIKNLKESGLENESWRQDRLPSLMIGEYLIDPRLSEGAGLQDVITVAIKREQYSVEFYIAMKQAAEAGEVRRLCERLISAELGHKARLEKFYEDLFYKEN